LVFDWEPIIDAILEDLNRTTDRAVISAKFHNTMIAGILDLCEKIGMEKVVLSGGCFQNRILSEGVIRGLEEKGFQPYWHQRIPPNDGGIALGQIAALRQSLKNRQPMGGKGMSDVFSLTR
jgi:hydrogenase maturation protein HypF